MKIFYGTKDSLKDVTEIAIQKYKKDDIIEIPGNRIKRKYAFGKVSGTSIIKVVYDDGKEEIFDNNTPVVLDMNNPYYNLEPHLDINDKIMFYKYLDKATFYFEFGSGGSTFQACKKFNIDKIYSIESDKEWYNKLSSVINNDNFNYIFNNVNARNNNWGRPGKYCTNQQKINYSNHIVNLSDEEKNKIDLVFIDGRFRVACCLKSFNCINDNCLVIFDDFLNRPYYHVVLDYFDIIENTKDNRMVVLKKKNNIIIPDYLIKKYELIEL